MFTVLYNHLLCIGLFSDSPVGTKYSIPVAGIRFLYVVCVMFLPDAKQEEKLLELAGVVAMIMYCSPFRDLVVQLVLSA